MSFLKEQRAQISAEMIIVMAALLAVAIVLITRMTKTSKDAAVKIDDKAGEVIKQLDQLGVDTNT